MVDSLNRQIVELLIGWIGFIGFIGSDGSKFNVLSSKVPRLNSLRSFSTKNLTR